jgi:hypothetical protein
LVDIVVMLCFSCVFSREPKQGFIDDNDICFFLLASLESQKHVNAAHVLGSLLRL